MAGKRGILGRELNVQCPTHPSPFVASEGRQGMSNVLSTHMTFKGTEYRRCVLSRCHSERSRGISCSAQDLRSLDFARDDSSSRVCCPWIQNGTNIGPWEFPVGHWTFRARFLRNRVPRRTWARRGRHGRWLPATRRMNTCSYRCAPGRNGGRNRSSSVARRSAS